MPFNLDSRIALSGVVPQLRSAAEARFDQLKNRQAEQTVQLNDQKLREAGASEDDLKIWQEAGGDIEKVPDLLVKYNRYDEAVKLRKSIDEHKAAMNPPVRPEAVQRTREVKVKNADGTETTKIIADEPGQDFISAAPPAIGSPDRVETRSLEVQAADALARGDVDGYKRILKVAKEVRMADDRPLAGGGSEPLVPIMGPDNLPVLVPRSQAAGKRPANTREQGRPVTSGDAGRITDFDTSLNDLKTLTATIGTEGSTGILPSVGAAVPNWATSMTGFGTGAKQRQAVIDRVKQVIGKALEGGVLRKEDEMKYIKILPTISDPIEVVKTKIAGLQTAIAQRKSAFLDNLADAGYDTARFQARGAAPAASGSKFKIISVK